MSERDGGETPISLANDPPNERARARRARARPSREGPSGPEGPRTPLKRGPGAEGPGPGPLFNTQKKKNTPAGGLGGCKPPRTTLENTGFRGRRPRTRTPCFQHPAPEGGCTGARRAPPNKKSAKLTPLQGVWGAVSPPGSTFRQQVGSKLTQPPKGVVRTPGGLRPPDPHEGGLAPPQTPPASLRLAKNQKTRARSARGLGFCGPDE